MGWYIEGPPKGKVRFLKDVYGARVVQEPVAWGDHGPDAAFVCVVDNGPFEAAAYLFNSDEVEDFTRPNDPRPRTILLMDRALVEQLSGYDTRNKR